MAKYIVELKDDELGIPISKNQLLVALAHEFGLVRVVSVENASRQSVQRTADNVRENQGVSGQEAAGHSWLVGATRRR